MKTLKNILIIVFIITLTRLNNLQAQFNFLEYADSTQILLVFDNEQDTAAINELKHELQAIVLAITPYSRIQLWQIPPDTIVAYGGVSQIMNHAIGKPRIKGGSMNYSVPLIFNIDDDDDDDDEPGIPQYPLCYNDSLFACTAGTTKINMAFLDTGFDGEPTGKRSVWMPNHNIFKKRPWQNAGEAGKSLNKDNDKNGFVDDVKGWDFHYNDNLPLDDNGHGSHVAGLAALKQSANSDSSRNKIMMLKTHSQGGEASMWQLVQALDYAVRHDVNLINLSLAYLSPVNGNGKPTIMEYVMEFAKTYKGILFVAAAGNDSINVDLPIILNNGLQVKYCPASLPNDNLIVVAAGTCDYELASFSNYGAVNVDIAAPGIEIYSALLDGTYGYLTGTSMAAPHVTAAAALAASSENIFSWKQIKHDLLNRSIPSAALTGYVSSGRMLTFCENYLPSPNPLMVTAKANSILCINSNTSISAFATGGQSPYTFAWSNGSSGQSCTINAAGAYTVTVTDAAGSTASESLNVFSASAPFAQTALQSVSCSDSCTVLEIVNAVAGANYLWSNGLKTTSINVCPDISNTFSVTTTTPNGCTSITQVIIPTLHPEVAPLNDTIICPCTPTKLKAVAQGGIGPLNYLWSPGNETTQEITISLNNGSETYLVMVSDSRGCMASTSALVTTLCMPPIAATATFNPQNQITTFNWAKGPCNINRFQIRWRCNSNDPWNIITISDTAANSYSAILPAGCAPQWQIRNRCCNNINSSWNSQSGTRTLTDNPSISELTASINIYPNPVRDIIYLDWDNEIHDGIVYIYNFQGNLVRHHNMDVALNIATISIYDLSPGLYFIRCGGAFKPFLKQ